MSTCTFCALLLINNSLSSIGSQPVKAKDVIIQNNLLLFITFFLNIIYFQSNLHLKYLPFSLYSIYDDPEEEGFEPSDL